MAWSPRLEFQSCDFPNLPSTEVAGQLRDAQSCWNEVNKDGKDGKFATYDPTTFLCYSHDRTQVPSLSGKQPNTSTPVSLYTQDAGYLYDVLYSTCGIGGKSPQNTTDLCVQLWDQAKNSPLGKRDAFKLFSHTPLDACLPWIAQSIKSDSDPVFDCKTDFGLCVPDAGNKPWNYRCINGKCGIADTPGCTTDAQCNPPGTALGIDGALTCSLQDDGKKWCGVENPGPYPPPPPENPFVYECIPDFQKPTRGKIAACMYGNPDLPCKTDQYHGSAWAAQEEPACKGHCTALYSHTCCDTQYDVEECLDQDPCTTLAGDSSCPNGREAIITKDGTCYTDAYNHCEYKDTQECACAPLGNQDLVGKKGHGEWCDSDSDCLGNSCRKYWADHDRCFQEEGGALVSSAAQCKSANMDKNNQCLDQPP